MTAAGMLVPLGTTPPLTSARGTKRMPGGGTLVVGFRSSDSAEAGSVPNSSVPNSGVRTSRSGPESGSYALSRSLGRQRAASEGISVSRPITSQVSIPKSATFVKVEGFATPTEGPTPVASPGASPPASPQPKSLAGSSLLSRQLTTGRLTPAGSDEPSLLVQQLERAVGGPPGSPAVVLPSRPQRRVAVPDDLLQQLQRSGKYPVFNEPLVVRAFNISRSAHDGQYRASGDPAFLHCVEVARQLAGMGANEETVAAALLHDVLEDTPLWEDQLAGMLGNDTVVALVKQVSHLAYVSNKYRHHPATSNEGQAATAQALVSMMVGMERDPSALLIALADRVHDMQTLRALPPATRNRLARETMDVWAPLANRLGVWKLKASLEDLAFRQLNPEGYGSLAQALDAAQAEDGLQPVVDKFRDSLAARGLTPTELTARRKNVWGVYTKMQAKGYSLDRIHDVRGVRVIVETKEQCYEALRAIYDHFEADMSREKNYIRSPKPNNYQSLHAVVRAADGHWVEVQIRTRVMHYLAEYGKDAAHWTYKEGGRSSVRGGGVDVSLDDGQEARWAKFNASQQVSDHKCRPSGSPPGQKQEWLESIVACSSSGGAVVGGAAPATAVQATTSAVDGSRSSGSSSSPKRDFIEYLKWSEQTLTPHSAGRELVCLVSSGGLSVRAVPKGTCLGDLLASVGPAAASDDAHILVNKQLESASRRHLLRTGDIVEVYCPSDVSWGAAPLSPAPSGSVALPSSLVAAPPPGSPRPASPLPVASPAAVSAVGADRTGSNVVTFKPAGSQGNVVPLSGLSAKLRAHAAAVAAPPS